MAPNATAARMAFPRPQAPAMEPAGNVTRGRDDLPAEIGLPRRLPGAGLRSGLHRHGGAGRGAAGGHGAGLHRLRRHRALAPCRAPDEHHAAALAAADGAHADHPDGWGDDQGGRPELPLGRAPASVGRGDRRQRRRHPQDLRALPRLRGGRDGRPDARQRRVAGRAQLPRVPARRGPALLDQPDAELRERQEPARPRAEPELSRIQLHDPAGLRLRGAAPPPRLPPPDGRLATSGATS